MGLVGDRKSPILLLMIDKKKIEKLVNEAITDGFFVVKVSVSTSNKIQVYIDSAEGARIDDCIKVSRHIEGNLDREEEDFELEVSTPGLSEPFLVDEQYIKNIGRNVEVTLNNGEKISGKLLSFNNGNIELEVEKTIKPEGSKKKKKIKEVHNIKLDDIKSTIVVISFK